MTDTDTDSSAGSRTAIVLFNLGGPGSLDEVQAFLFNLFNDPAIIGLPGILRWLVAKLISRRRTPVAQEIYRQMGDRSPILPETRKQQLALQETLKSVMTDGSDVGVFIAMRYSPPRAEFTVEVVKAFAPDEIVLLPLYPQFSTTTTGSSVKEWQEVAARSGLDVPTRVVCCYPAETGLIGAHATAIAKAFGKSAAPGSTRVLFSAHGLPQKIVDKGDPYPQQIEETVAAIVKRLKDVFDIDLPDYVVCYQSRVGPVKWIGPSTDDEIRRAGADARSVIVVPVAFVSEHSETLVELDIEYAELAREAGVKQYIRVPAVGDEGQFIDGLAAIIRHGCERSAACSRAPENCFRERLLKAGGAG